ncbi:hypothetical protein [Bordetella bronchiseptica]|uniref:hypothetical protein n=1 Tax=Bordetella bronchiseptica TaxID=518 RepID=UPI000460E1EE|nr:hypothetical protein [Bordetella bronchiseptica]KAB1444206.1 hypothetical protein F7D00_21350 [Bordetella bronchiseptica]KAB1569312.1 hypothetical protein F7890_21350 [Bordetella bronchiseptica]KDB58413.1 hypothetical protein AZ15_1937 [Bordetella bronchiseptica A1-7]KDB73049.1 hypothetical protein AZ21_2253 [Bordetella bronchiseptica B20-10725633]KDC23972.1 hypothetical protein L505_3648 [Bordetella bronchiseptica F4563]
MALVNITTENTVVTVNGREITDWGEAESPVTEEPIDAKTTIRRGMGGNAARLDRINPGRRVTLSLNPGGADSAFMQGLFNSNANITYTRTVIGTLENSVGSEGAIVNDGAVNRAGGTSISDDVFIMEFNAFTGLKGG